MSITKILTIIYIILILTVFFLLLPNSCWIYSAGVQEEVGGYAYPSGRQGESFADAPSYFITAYCDKGIMASGKEVYSGAIACPREMKLGQKVIIQDREYTCEDRTHIRYNGRFDIWMESCDDAILWGIKSLKVQIYE